jgi:hypothetical protein
VKELCPFFSGEQSPLPRFQSVKRNMHDPNTMEREYSVSQDLTHTPNLSIASFREDDAESRGTESFNPARFGRTLENDHSLSHAVGERLIERMID